MLSRKHYERANKQLTIENHLSKPSAPTSHNRRLSEMSVGVEAAVPPRPYPLAVAQASAHPFRHVRQATGRYVIYVLLLWNIEMLFLILFAMRIIHCGGYYEGDASVWITSLLCKSSE